MNELEKFKKKLIYRSNYRGTKEMDILLSKFVKKYSDKMNQRDFKEMVMRLMIQVDSMFYWRASSDKFDNPCYGAQNYQLSGTPLDESLVIMRDYLKEFKRQYGIDVMSFIALTDGEVFEVSTQHFDEDSYRVFKGDTQ